MAPAVTSANSARITTDTYAATRKYAEECPEVRRDCEKECKVILSNYFPLGICEILAPCMVRNVGIENNLFKWIPSGPTILSFAERGCPLSEVMFYRVCTIQEYFQLVLCWEVCPLSECPLLEVSSYSLKE